MGREPFFLKMVENLTHVVEVDQHEPVLCDNCAYWSL